jgi:RNA-directed DNA polymerase
MTTNLILRMSEATGLSVPDVEHIVATAPRRYKVFKIPKKNDRGWREIAQPSRELKALQRFLVQRVLNGLPVHEAVHGYVVGKGIKTNASAHAGSNYLLKLDLTNFFPSLKPADLRNHLRHYAPDLLSREEERQASLTMFWLPKKSKAPRLCIGAPSSPFLSNTLMFGLDVSISKICEEEGVCYTRYADDMSFSCLQKDTLGKVQHSVTELIHGSKHPKLRINDEKTVHISRAQRRVVTGIVINAVGNLSIGRDRKRLIRSMVHRHTLRQLTVDQQNELQGLIAFSMHIDPKFAASMHRRLAGCAPLGDNVW